MLSNRDARNAALLCFALFTMAVLAFVLVLSTLPLWAGEIRVDLYDGRSNRTGYAVVDQSTGRVDFFDLRSNRTGHAFISPPPAPTPPPAPAPAPTPRPGAK